MKIHKIWAENVRGISNRVTVELSPTGLNLITAPNEMGKTTIAQVLDYIFQWKSNSKASEIQNLKPYGKDVSPLMGAVIEVNGQTYLIEKQWLKGEKTEIELISPEIGAHSGPAAEKIIDEIFKKHLDQTVWNMIQVAQGDFGTLLNKEYGVDERDMLRTYLGRAVTNVEDVDDESLAEKAEKEYLAWWTPKTEKIATSAGTLGKQISDRTKELEESRYMVSDLEVKIGEASSIKEEIIQNRGSREILQKRKKAQEANRALLKARSELKIRTDVEGDIEKLLADSPSIKNFNQEIFENLSDDRSAFAQYNALTSIKLTALGESTLEINGKSVSLPIGTSIDQKLESPLNITIPNILSIDYIESDTESEGSLEEGANRYLAGLKNLGCESFQEAQELNRQHSEYKRLRQNQETLTKIADLQSLQTDISNWESIKADLPDWEVDVSTAPVTAEDLEEVAQQVGQQEGRSEEISRFGWHSNLEETREKILDLEKRISVLNKRAQAARMLYKVLTRHKESAEKDYSVHFAKFINDLAQSFYGEDVSFNVSESFEIVSRRLNGIEVDVADLSTGAKEQLAILIRLALTQIVQVGEPFPVILDDEFAHSDPERIAMMDNIFTDFGDEQQFIMLTCYPDKFAGYKPAKTIDLAALRGA